MTDVLSDDALDELERKRKAATPGPWGREDYPVDGDLWETPVVSMGSAIMRGAKGGDVRMAETDVDYIAAANPVAVGRLIAEVREYRRVKANLAAHGVTLQVPPEEKTDE